MALRPIWEGHPRLPLVAHPVSLLTAAGTTNEIHLRLFDRETGHRVHLKTIDPEGDETDCKTLLRSNEFKAEHSRASQAKAIQQPMVRQLATAHQGLA
jgi:non-homologous end joining protein Ku